MTLNTTEMTCLRRTSPLFAFLAALSVSTIFAADKPAAKHFYRPLVVEPPTIAAGDSVSNRCTDASQPCYANNKDILKGTRSLLKVQDVVLAGVFTHDGQSDQAVVGSINYTTNSAITTTTDSGVSIFSNGAPDNIQIAKASAVQTAHLYASDRNNSDKAVVISAVFGKSFNNHRSLQINASPEPSVQQVAIYDLGADLDVYQGDYTLLSAAADLTGDGYDELIFATYGKLIVISAQDPNNPAGFRAGAVYSLNDDNGGFPQSTSGVVVGTFGGKTQIAVLASGYNAVPTVEMFTVDKDLNIARSGFRELTPESPASLSMTAGHFTRSDSLQLVAQYTTQLPDGNQYLVSVDFDANGAPTVSSASQVGSGRVYSTLRTGHFDPLSPFDQVVGLLTTPSINDSYGLEYYTFGPDFSVTKAAFYHNDQATCTYDMQVGNFDRRDNATGTGPQPNGTPNLADQVAVMTADSGCGSAGYNLAIFNVSAQSGKVVQESSATQHRFESPSDRTYINSLKFTAADIQGRSLTLGDPQIVTFLERQKISQILAMPPMHVDAVRIDPGDQQQLYNFTVAPSGYNAAFDMVSQQTNSLSSKYTSTWSFASQETANASYTEGYCGDGDGDCLKFDSKFSAKQALDGSTANDNSASSSLEYQLNLVTSDSDLVLYSGSALTDYIYPVIGKTVCPGASSNGGTTCDPSKRVPETVQFAGVDSVVRQVDAGVDLPWYQPVWMFGNVLSYPTNECQLEIDSFGACGSSDDSAGALQELSNKLTVGPDVSAVQTNTWTNNKESGSTTAFNQNYSFDLNTSFTAEGNFLVGSLSAGFDLDLSGSFGFQSLVDSRTETQASNGIKFTRTSIFPKQPGSDTWGYTVTSRIFGQQQPVTTPDAKVPNNADSPTQPDITSFGTMRTAFVVAPTGAIFMNQGAFPGWYARGVDIGLNQPRHWYFVPGQTASATCLLTSSSNSQADCAALSKVDPNPFQDEFHGLRGFFVIPQVNSGPQPKSTGPQIERVKYDQPVTLRVRVYNFSTVDSSVGQSIHARFYGLDPATGSSAFLGEGTAASISHWGSDIDTTNWTYIDLPFTPGAARINRDLYFWVVVWAQNADGSLVKDLESHGLTAIPPQNVQWNDVKNYEEQYSNNVGFYNSQIFVLGEEGTTATGGNTSIEIISAATERTSIHLGDSSQLTVRAQTGAAPIHLGMNFKFYDGDPRFGGNVIGLRRIPYLRAGDTYEVGVNYRPRGLGSHEIFVSVGEKTKFQHTVQLRTITVLPQ